MIECEEIWYDYIISAIVKRSDIKPLNGFSKHQDKIISEIHRFINRYPPGQVAIWGAGHQAFAIMSLASLGDKIKYVIDDATFKQGKYTPATHIPILSSNSIIEDPPKAIMVMAGGYSDEVAKKVRKNFDVNIDVCILREEGIQHA